MKFDLMVGHRQVFALHRNAGELISLDELKRQLYACLADDVAVTLCIHITDTIDLADMRAALSKLYVVLAFGLCTKAWRVEVNHW